jgi:hypothetical protein
MLVRMSRTRWALVGLCLLGACSSGSGNGSTKSTTTTVPPVGTIAPNAWRDVATGVYNGKSWKISAATSSAKWRCYDPQGSARRADDTGSSALSRDGRPVHCLGPVSAHQSRAFAAFIDGAERDQWVVVGAAADGVKRVQIVFADKTATTLNIDPKSRLVIWKGPASVHPKSVRADTETCTLAAAKTAGGVSCDA